jgi:hypothetical protein
MLHAIDESLECGVINRRDESKSKYWNATRELQLGENIGERAFARAKGDESNDLTLAWARQTRRDIEFEPTRNAKEIRRVAKSRGTTQSALQNQLIDRRHDAIRTRGNRFHRREYEPVHDNRNGHCSCARKAQRLLDRIAKTRKIRGLHHGKTCANRETPRANHRLIFRVVLEHNHKALLWISERRARTTQSFDRSDKIRRRNHRDSAATTAHRAQRDRNRTRSVTAEVKLGLVPREQRAIRLRLRHTSKRREARDIRGRDDADLNHAFKRTFENCFARIEEHQPFGGVERCRGVRGVGGKHARRIIGARARAGSVGDSRAGSSAGSRGTPEEPARFSYPLSVRYRLVITDLDGTLLNRRGQVSEANLLAIRRLQDAGVEVIPATGRALREADHVLDFINHVGHAIMAGGALVHDASDGRVIIRRGLPEDLVRGTSAILAEYGILSQHLQDHTCAGFDYVMVGDHAFDPATKWWFEVFPVTYQRVASIEHHPSIEHTVRVGGVAPADVLAPIAQRIAREFGDRLAVQHWSAQTSEEAINSPTHLLEAFDRGVNKWTAIEAVCAELGIDPAETVAIGDGLNDLEMIRHAGLGIAMENADPRIAAVARARAGHHDRDGFAAVAEIVLQANR